MRKAGVVLAIILLCLLPAASAAAKDEPQTRTVTGQVTDKSDAPLSGAIVYLENAPFVTGEILHVDGGQSAGH